MRSQLRLPHNARATLVEHAAQAASVPATLDHVRAISQVLPASMKPRRRYGFDGGHGKLGHAGHVTCMLSHKTTYPKVCLSMWGTQCISIQNYSHKIHCRNKCIASYNYNILCNYIWSLRSPAWYAA
jgi:hypothetical protein